MIGLSSTDPNTAAHPQNSLISNDRVIARIRGAKAGPTLLCVTGLHGNEPAGAAAFSRVARVLSQENIEIRGALVGLRGNLAAADAGVRFLRCDLNRQWTEQNIARLQQPDVLATNPEAVEMQALLQQFARLENEARGPLLALDFHTTSAPSAPFCVVSDTLANRALALHLPVPILLGLEEHIAGTLPTYLCQRGYVAFGFEGGVHADPHAVDCCEAALWIILETAGMIDRSAVPRRTESRTILRDAAAGLPHFFEVRQRYAVTNRSAFRMAPGFRNFDRVRWGQLLAADHGNPVRTDEAGNILMPLYQGQGDDGFFIVRPVRKVWLAASKRLRGKSADRLLRWMPGIDDHPTIANAVRVRPQIARWLTREVLHMLGYQRVGLEGDCVVFRKRDARSL